MERHDGQLVGKNRLGQDAFLFFLHHSMVRLADRGVALDGHLRRLGEGPLEQSVALLSVPAPTRDGSGLENGGSHPAVAGEGLAEAKR